MAGNSTARFGFDYFLKFEFGFNPLLNQLYEFGIGRTVRYKHARIIVITIFRGRIVNILSKGALHAAAKIFLFDRKRAVAYSD